LNGVRFDEAYLKESGYLLQFMTNLDNQPYELHFQGESEKTIELVVWSKRAEEMQYFLIRQVYRAIECATSIHESNNALCQNWGDSPRMLVIKTESRNNPRFHTLRLGDETVNRWVLSMKTLERFSLDRLDWPTVEEVAMYRLGSEHLYVRGQLWNEEEQVLVLKDFFAVQGVSLALRINQIEHLINNQTYQESSGSKCRAFTGACINGGTVAEKKEKRKKREVC